MEGGDLSNQATEGNFGDEIGVEASGNGGLGMVVFMLFEGFPSFLEGRERSTDDATANDAVALVLVSNACVDPWGLSGLDDAAEIDSARTAFETQSGDGKLGVVGDAQQLVVGSDAFSLFEVDRQHRQKAG